jgi:hypothetical protein
MVKVAILCMLLSTASVAFGADQCTRGSDLEPVLCAFHLPRVTKVEILDNAAGSPDVSDGIATCSGFRITQSQVRRYLQKAKMTSGSEAHAKLDWSPCHATGELVLSDGRKGRWDINLSCAGSVSVEGADNVILYCPDCTFKPFNQ